MPGDITGIVNHRIPLAAPKRIELRVAIPFQMLQLREQIGVGLAAVEQGHGVPAFNRQLRDVHPEKLGAAQD